MKIFRSSKIRIFVFSTLKNGENFPADQANQITRLKFSQLCPAVPEISDIASSRVAIFPLIVY